MWIDIRRIRCVLSSSLLLLVNVSQANAAPVEGDAKVRLAYVFATLQNGTPDKKPEDTAACHKQVSAPNSKYLGSPVATHYSIDPQSLMMSASSTLPAPLTTTPLELTIPLSALGIAGQYAFGAFRPAALPNTYVLFSISLAFKEPKSSILVLNSDKAYNCLVSSDPKPFGTGLSGKYGADQK